jgi:sucrose-6-phosphate hydrolase SacC (GH32 family)
MRWKKLGIIYCPKGENPWAKSHAMIPTPIQLNAEVIRVFTTFCDAEGVGRPGYVDLSAIDPTQVLGVSSTPLLDLGANGSFDENGILVCSVVDAGNGQIFMYYVGFELGVKIRYRLLTGLAISEDGGNTFSRYSKCPILERSDEELHFRAGPFCSKTPEGFRLWYVAGSDWISLNGKPMPIYDIRYMESKDGIHWPKEGQVVLPVTRDDEHGFGRPAVIPNAKGGYSMFYSIRRRSFGAYRLGYAESTDGIHWNRLDESLNLDVTSGSFDSDGIMYAYPLEVNGKLYLFYNGNEFGKDGFALAVLES